MYVKNIDKQLTAFSMECFYFECYQVQLNDEQNKDFPSSVVTMKSSLILNKIWNIDLS